MSASSVSAAQTPPPPPPAPPPCVVALDTRTRGHADVQTRKPIEQMASNWPPTQGERAAFALCPDRPGSGQAVQVFRLGSRDGPLSRQRVGCRGGRRMHE
ncbi:hypothetical protein C2857_001108 [Epichloe festucae Fl1]|uniref:Uncharacterized protein n=1 Tax=Epichloe festucae (strain Fl1) TaxID=877507 RepID=A0A7S9PRP9_EPIFF|nr:hypothetical protein C2857_001108 [Epichloe festucae Fl1]